MFLFLSVNILSNSLMPWDVALILLGLGILVPWRGAVRVKRLLDQPSLTSKDRLSLYGSTIAFQWLIVLVVGWRAFSDGFTHAELGLTWSFWPQTAWIAAGLTLLLCINQWFGLKKMAEMPADQRGFLFLFTEKIMPRTRNETIVFVALACTAGLSEEFLYRGFVFSVFMRVLASSGSVIWMAAALSSAWFAVGHLYQGRRGLITTFIVGMVFAGARIWSHSLVPPMVAHAGIDVIAGLFASKSLEAS
jgi:membrane protease YdiL (CAAX protease family)